MTNKIHELPFLDNGSPDWDRYETERPAVVKFCYQLYGAGMRKLVSLFNPLEVQQRIEIFLGRPDENDRSFPKIRNKDGSYRIDYPQDGIRVRVIFPAGETRRIPAPWAEHCHVTHKETGIVMSGHAPGLRLLDDAGNDVTPPIHPSLLAGIPDPAHPVVPRVRRVK